jgi:hypothetical protein
MLQLLEDLRGDSVCCGMIFNVPELVDLSHESVRVILSVLIQYICFINFLQRISRLAIHADRSGSTTRVKLSLR